LKGGKDVRFLEAISSEREGSLPAYVWWGGGGCSASRKKRILEILFDKRVKNPEGKQQQPY